MSKLKLIVCTFLVKSGSYKELVLKNNLFLLGNDIWAEEESRSVRMKKKMCETDVEKPKTAIQVSACNIP